MPPPPEVPSGSRRRSAGRDPVADAPRSRLRFWAATIARVVLAFSPAIGLAFLVDRYAVNIPMWDDWERAPLIEKWKEGNLTWTDLYAPHISHRIVVPRLIMLGLAAATGGDLVAEVWVTFGITLLTGIGVYVLLRRTLGPDRPGLHVATFFVNLLLFSPLQGQNLLWPIQHAFVLPMACAVWALVVLGSRRLGTWVKFGIALVLALAANHSFHHGVLVWIVVLLYVVLEAGFGGTRRERWGFLAAWAILFLVTSAFYYDPDTFRNASHPSHAYNHPVGERPPGMEIARVALERPDKLATFFFGMLGSPFARQWPFPVLSAAVAIGAAILAMFAVAAGRWIWRFRDADLRDRGLPWLALGGMAVSGCLMVALARSGTFASFRALSPRYLGISLHLCAALVPLWLLLQRPVPAGAERLGGGRRRDAGLVLAGAALVLLGIQWSYGIQTMHAHWAARLHARTNLLFLNVFPPDRIERLDASYDLVRKYAGILARYDMLDPAPLDSPSLERFRTAGSPLSPSRAGFTLLEPDEDEIGGLHAAGHAELPGDAGRSADGVVLTASTVSGPGPGTPVALADIHAFPTMWFHFWDFEFNGIRLFDKHEFARWSKRFVLPPAMVGPDRTLVVEAWAVDAAAMRLHRLPERYRIEIDETGSLAVHPMPE